MFKLKDLLKSAWDEIWNRVIVNYIPTLVGMAWAVGVVVSDQFFGWAGSLNLPPWATNLIALAGAAIGAYAKSKAKSPVQPVP